MNKLELYPKYVLRSPSFSISKFYNSILNVTNKNEFDEFINRYLSNDFFKDALSIASTNLFNKVYSSKDKLSKRELEELSFSILRYIIRISSRSTPFGLFSHLSVGDWTHKNEIVVSNYSNHKYMSRFDMSLTVAFSNYFQGIDDFKSLLYYSVNNTLYTVGGEIRFFESTLNSKSYEHKIVGFESSYYIDLLLKSFQGKKRIKYGALIKFLLSQGLEESQAQLFLNDVIFNQILVSELAPSLIGKDYFNTIVDVFDREDEKVKQSPILKSCQSNLYKLRDKLPDITSYSARDSSIHDLRSKIREDVHMENNDSIQIDLSGDYKQNTLSAEISDRLKKLVMGFNTMTNKLRDQKLKNYISRFYAKYEFRTVPLLEALDDEIGVPYIENTSGSITSFLSGLLYTKSGKSKKETFSKSDTKFLHKYFECIYDRTYSYELNDENWETGERDWTTLPDTFSLMIQLIGTDNAAEEPLIFIKGGGVGNAASIIGRFTFLDHDIEKMSKELCAIDAGSNPDKIYASISYLPKPKFGNFLKRVNLYKYEIPILTSSKISFENIIELKDLHLFVKNGRLLLWSKRLNKEVVPRLCTAHNYNYNSIPAYNLLCDLQYQGSSIIPTFHWGQLSLNFNFLPRIQYKNIIVSRSTWQFKKSNLDFMLNKGVDEDKFLKWRLHWNIPRLISLIEGDNELFIDLENQILKELFIKEISCKSTIQFCEFLGNPNQQIVKNENNDHFTSEFLICYYKEKVANLNQMPTSAIQIRKDVKRKFNVGSEWIYFKIYSSEQVSNRLFCEYIYPVLLELELSSQIDQWFFIRYNDNKPHLRLRIHSLSGSEKIITKITSVCQSYINSGLISNITLDSYVRELEKYNFQNIDTFEKLFHFDSLCVSSILNVIVDSVDFEKLQHISAIISIHFLLSDFEELGLLKEEFLEKYLGMWNSEFDCDIHAFKIINKRYKEFNNSIKELACNAQSKLKYMHIVAEIRLRSDRFKPLIVELREANIPVPKLEEFLFNIIHLSINRLSFTEQRMHEMMYYNIFQKLSVMLEKRNMEFSVFMNIEPEILEMSY